MDDGLQRPLSYSTFYGLRGHNGLKIVESINWMVLGCFVLPSYRLRRDEWLSRWLGYLLETTT
jgi:hypothetical protein